MSCPLSQALDYKKEYEACQETIEKFQEGYENGTLSFEDLAFFKDATDKVDWNYEKMEEYRDKVSDCKRENKVSQCDDASCYDN
jgi:hypothetical protein